MVSRISKNKIKYCIICNEKMNLSEYKNKDIIDTCYICCVDYETKRKTKINTYF